MIHFVIVVKFSDSMKALQGITVLCCLNIESNSDKCKLFGNSSQDYRYRQSTCHIC